MDHFVEANRKSTKTKRSSICLENDKLVLINNTLILLAHTHPMFINVYFVCNNANCLNAITPSLDLHKKFRTPLTLTFPVFYCRFTVSFYDENEQFRCCLGS